MPLELVDQLGLFESEEERLAGQLQTWHLFMAYASSLTIKAACVLRIPDILASQGPGAALTLHEIASRIDSPVPPKTDYLFRLLRFLCAKGVFRSTQLVDSSEPTYSLTPISKCLVQDQKNALLQTSQELQAAWHHLSDCILHGGQGFEKAHGIDVYGFGSQHPEFNQLFNSAMATGSEIVLSSILKHYRGFENIHTLVDVGGGTGMSLSRITAQYPSIKAINFDLPHVVATAPDYPGIEHVGGDMFKSIPSADAVLIVRTLHNWGDEACIAALTNSRKALDPQKGKVIIVDAVLETLDEKQGGTLSDPFQMLAIQKLTIDVQMMLNTYGGKERTRQEWQDLLRAAGFPRFKITDLPGSQYSLIEAFPQP